MFTSKKIFFFRYFINFEVRKGISYISDIAIDDVSLSPECFGLNIPPEELNGYNYWNPEEHVLGRETHESFINETCKLILLFYSKNYR